MLALAPDAGTPGMHDQFRCHWELAETRQPGKSSWNLEPWRPVVDDDDDGRLRLQSRRRAEPF